MRFLPLVLTGSLLAFPAAAAQDVRVVDGDTIDVDGERMRIIGLDAPETRQARCEADCTLGERPPGARLCGTFSR